VAGPYPNSWQVQNVSNFQTPNWAFSAPGFSLTLTAFPDTIEPGQSTTLTATATPPLSNLTYTWNLGDGTTSTASSPLTHIYQAPGTYLAIVIAQSPEGCIDTAAVRIVVNILTSIFIPNFFSPNGDGVNDLWTPSVTGIKNARWILYDRWGMEVFRGEGLPIVWDGTKGGQVCPEGVYTYLIEVERFDGEKVRKAGTITLLR
jgi:gliding motility-associated-like protein